ncbi:alkaline phosphatase family protein [Longispora urticae]
MHPRNVLALAATLALGTAVVATPAHAAAPTPHVLHIGIDGLLATRVDAANAPNLKKLRAEGTDGRSLLYANPMAATSSGPGWSTMLTGVWPDKHLVKDNSFSGNKLNQYPDWLSRAESANPALNTWAAMDWKAIGDNIIGNGLDTKLVYNGDADGYVGHDATIATKAETHLRDDAADATFAYFGQVDIVGHNSGASSQAYLTEIARIDGYVGRLLAAVAARPNRANEKWLVLVGTDHGHTPGGGHGGSTLDERTTFVLAWGDGVGVAKPKTTRLVDLSATALTHLGVAVPAVLDGRPVTVVDADPFESVTLKPAVMESIPASILGWNSVLPTGWSRDTSALPAGGVTEWAGWSLTTDAFWTSAQRDQGRETFVRGRGTIAVADSDEWADTTASTGKTYDSTLWTPSKAVAGSTVKVNLTHWYRQEGNQRGYVVVKWNGGATQTVKTYSADSVNGLDSLTLTAPAGATSVQVGFRLVGVNNWYWAVDDVRVS